MSKENKNIENNQEENQNREECNKKWWKNVGLKPTLQALKLILLIYKYINIILKYIFICFVSVIKVNLSFFHANSYKQKNYSNDLFELWNDEYNQKDSDKTYDDYTKTKEISELSFFSICSNINCKPIAEYFFSNNMFHLSSIFYSKYYSHIFTSERYYYKAICTMERIKNDYFYANNKEYILKIYITILRIITFYYLQLALLLCNDDDLKFNIYKNLGIISNSLNIDKKVKYYFSKAINIKPNDSLIINNFALFYTKNKKTNHKNIDENELKAIRNIHLSLKYSTENNVEKVFCNLIRILRHYEKNINIKIYKNILYKIKYNDWICCSYIAKNYKSISEKETIFCMKQISKIVAMNIYKQISHYEYLVSINLPKKYIEEYKYYMIYNAYLVFYHLKKLDLLKYFLVDEVKLPYNLKKKFFSLI